MQSADYIKELSKCVRCGSCKAYCPTYDEGLTEAMGARGRLTLLRGLLSHQITPSPLLNERIFSCILCGACENLCPPNLDITEAIYNGRRFLRHLDPRIRYLGFLMRFAVRRPMLSFRTAKILQQIGLSPFKIFGPLSTPFNFVLPNTPLRDDQQVYKPERKIGRIALFTGCSVNYLLPHLGISLINILLHLGYEVVLPKGEVCCGAPFRSLGLEDEAVELAKKNLMTFSKLNPEAILSLCPTCVLSIKVHYPKLIGKGLDNVMDVSSFLFDKLKSLQISPAESFKKVTYHDPCHLNYSLGIRKEPRELIKITGADLIESGGDGCCGFGGVFSLCYKELSMDILKKRSDAYNNSSAEAVITSCPGCMLQLSSGMNKPVFHIAELMEEAICSQAGRPVIIK